MSGLTVFAVLIIVVFGLFIYAFSSVAEDESEDSSGGVDE